MLKKILVVSACVVATVGCAKRAEQIQPSYVSPLMYSNMNCDVIHQEAMRVSHRVQVLTGEQDSKATRDGVATAVGIVVFWPALFFIGGDDAQTAEFARLKGEMDALRQASVTKGCPIEIQAAPAAAAQATS